MTAEYIAAPALAKRWGLKTGTLSKWRRLKKGPRGWYALSPTHVVYPLEEVERFEAERRSVSGGPDVTSDAQVTAPSPAVLSPERASACSHPSARRYSYRKAGRPQIGCAACGETIEPRMSEEAAS